MQHDVAVSRMNKPFLFVVILSRVRISCTYLLHDGESSVGRSENPRCCRYEDTKNVVVHDDDMGDPQSRPPDLSTCFYDSPR